MKKIYLLYKLVIEGHWVGEFRLFQGQRSSHTLLVARIIFAFSIKFIKLFFENLFKIFLLYLKLKKNIENLIFFFLSFHTKTVLK